MTEWRSTRFRNPAAWYVLLGTLLLLFSLWVPWLSASRTARTEGRADETAAALLDASLQLEPPFDEATAQILLARFYLLAESRGVRTKDIERLEPPSDEPGTWLLLRNKHYLFRVGASPVPTKQARGARISPRAVPAIEVIAWPLARVGPGHSAFFYPENAEAAYTRNLRKSYAGTGPEARPEPGAGHRRATNSEPGRDVYPGVDGERWLLF